MIDRLLNIIFPPLCLVCRGNVRENGTLCPSCWNKVDFISPPYCQKCSFPFEYEISHQAICGACMKYKPIYDTARSVMIYNKNSSKLITGLKYGDKTHGVKNFAKWMVQNNQDILHDIDYVIPVPIHRLRLLKRKYNQAALLAKQVAKLIDVQYIPDMLCRTRNTPPQASLDYDKRQKNVKDCFIINKKNKLILQDKSILIIDDVITTGATIKQCAKILKQQKTAKISILTIAKTIRK